MMIEIVTFALPETMSRDAVLEAYRAVAPKWRQVPELVRKSFIYDGEGRVGGAVYTWSDDGSAAARWHDADWVASVRATYGSEPEIRRFEMPLVADNAAEETVEHPPLR
jgi:hypothetical protein